MNSQNDKTVQDAPGCPSDGVGGHHDTPQKHQRRPWRSLEAIPGRPPRDDPGYDAWYSDYRKAEDKEGWARYHRDRSRHSRRTESGVRGWRTWAWRKKGIVGFTWDQYKDMYQRQDGRCVCGRKISLYRKNGSGGDPSGHVDHDHSTGKVRGILCGECNRILGLAREKTDTLRRLTLYLEDGGINLG